MNDTITARTVLSQVAQAIPQHLRADIIIVGSLAACYQLLKDVNQVVRTKDVDAMVAPFARAILTAASVTDKLLEAGWQPRASQEYELPGTEQTPDAKLAVVRLSPPNGGSWFFELLGAPPHVTPDQDSHGRTSARIKTQGGHFALPSFAYLGLVQFQPTLSEYGIKVALPEMMALANLLHHPVIGDAVKGQNFAGRQIKRSNKDLGRVVALGLLADQQDEDALEAWPSRWQEALQAMAPEHAERLLAEAPKGLEALLASPEDVDQALHTVNNGLLAAVPLTPAQFVIALRRLVKALQ